MKKITSLLIPALLICLIFTGCGKNNKETDDAAAFDRILYKNGLEKYVTLGEYKGIAVDTKSDEYKEIYDGLLTEDVENNNLYAKKTEGTIEEGDTANIDYEGKKDGVAFDGGTAQGYDLTIGSGTFIPGFEDGLIGKEIGSTVDLDLTFPEDYSSEELAGQAVVFTVKINYATSGTPLKPEEYFSELDFKTVDDYYKDVNQRAAAKFLLNKVTSEAKIKDYPKDDLSILYESYKNVMEQSLQQSYGIDFATYLQSVEQTEEDIKSNQIKPMMDSQMITYCILDREKLTFTEDDINNVVDDLIKQYGTNVTKEQINQYMGEYYLEAQAISNIVSDFLYENAEIK